MEPNAKTEKRGQPLFETGPREPAARCLLCGGARHQVVFTELGIDVLRCRNCRHVFSSFAGDPHYDGFWGTEVPESELFYYSAARAAMHRDFVARFIGGRSGRLLDMGCGLGYFLKVLEPHANWDAFGCEVSPAAARYARETLGLSNVACGPPQEADFPETSFDLITIWDVIDHVPHPDPLLQRCHRLLKDGGICFMRTPNAAVQLLRARLMKSIRGEHPHMGYLQPRDHMHLYSTGTIRRLLERNGFRDVEFLHLHPIEATSRKKLVLRRSVKNACFAAVRALAYLTAGRVNIDNLFVVARKPPR